MNAGVECICMCALMPRERSPLLHAISGVSQKCERGKLRGVGTFFFFFFLFFFSPQAKSVSFIPLPKITCGLNIAKCRLSRSLLGTILYYAAYRLFSFSSIALVYEITFCTSTSGEKKTKKKHFGCFHQIFFFCLFCFSVFFLFFVCFLRCYELIYRENLRAGSWFGKLKVSLFNHNQSVCVVSV